ncbi:hypothetical protein ACS0TY_001282 [Phlomoides rotata]
MFEVVKMLEDIITLNPISLENKRLVFVDDSNPTLNLKDLLRASAEVLGKGTFGTSYLVRLETGETVVVKRLRDVIPTLEDFQQFMEVLGTMRNKNVVQLRAYYFSRDEQLLVYDYYDPGNVYTMLHEKLGTLPTHLEWGTRLKIAVGAARGIAHIHGKDGQKIVHGNVKSSNIFINGQTYGVVSDAGLAKLTDPMSLARVLSRGYRAPEIKATWKVSQASDVYSFGVVLLELVCGRQSQLTANDGVATTLVKWVQAAVTDLGIHRIFDRKCLSYETEEAMKQVFEIAMDCVSTAPERRPTMPQVVQVLEEISEIKSKQGRGIGNNYLSIQSWNVYWKICCLCLHHKSDSCMGVFLFCSCNLENTRRLKPSICTRGSLVRRVVN